MIYITADMITNLDTVRVIDLSTCNFVETTQHNCFGRGSKCEGVGPRRADVLGGLKVCQQSGGTAGAEIEVQRHKQTYTRPLH